MVDRGERDDALHHAAFTVEEDCFSGLQDLRRHSKTSGKRTPRDPSARQARCAVLSPLRRLTVAQKLWQATPINRLTTHSLPWFADFRSWVERISRWPSLMRGQCDWWLHSLTPTVNLQVHVGWAEGIVTVIDRPPWSRGWAVAVPPWMAAMDFTIARPSPKPS